MKKGNKKKIVLPIALGVAVLLFFLIPYVAYLHENGNRDSGGNGPGRKNKAEVSYTNETYRKIYKNIEGYADYLYEQSQIVYEAETTASSDGTADSAPSYTDTNVRTEGVMEPDVVKTDGEYIYRTNKEGRVLFAYRVKDGEIEKLFEEKILEDYYYFKDLYIYGDKIIMMGTYNAPTGDYGQKNDEFTYGYNPYSETFITFVDVSDKSNPVVEKTVYQSGDYCSSRMMDGVIYTFSWFRNEPDIIKQKKIDTYVPAVDGEILRPDDLVVYDDTRCDFMVISSINAENQAVVDKKAIFGGSTVPYVSENAIYDTVWGWKNSNDTTLVKIAMYAGDLKFACEGTFPGNLLNDYSIDEYEGNLRLVTSYINDQNERRNALYVFDKNLEKVSTIKELAPQETIRSARFMGDIAYFVTYRVQDYFYDPLFAVDLSDPENPEITDYMKLPGFSGYLHPYGDNKLLGIGYDTDEDTGRMNCVKFSMFDITDPFDIKEEATCNFRACQSINVLSDRNSFMYNPADGTFGMGASISNGVLYYSEAGVDTYSDDWYTPEDATEINDNGALIQDEGPALAEDVNLSYSSFSYLVMDYDEEQGFSIKFNYDLGKNASAIELRNARGIVIGDYIYIVDSHNGVESFDTENYELVDTSI
ncbi:MAG: beta-propeller domain-containing protein [Eubacterium sp.]|nr:beta-propeller domain-containing protein [Eubacterium sp.]